MASLNQEGFQKQIFPKYVESAKENISSELEKIILQKLPGIINMEIAKLSAGIASLITLEYSKGTSRDEAELVIKIREKI